MSVTFWMPQAPVERIRPYPDDEPDYYDIVPVEPFVEVNLSNVNAYAFLSELDEESDPDACGGTWSPERCSVLLKRAIRLRNIYQERSMLLTETYRDGNFFYGGRDDEYVVRRLDQFIALFAAAIQNEFKVCYG